MWRRSDVVPHNVIRREITAGMIAKATKRTELESSRALATAKTREPSKASTRVSAQPGSGRGGGFRHESGVTTWTPEACLEEHVIQQGDRELNSEVVGLAVDAQKRLYVVEMHSGVLRIEQDGSVKHVVEVTRCRTTPCSLPWPRTNVCSRGLRTMRGNYGFALKGDVFGATLTIATERIEVFLPSARHARPSRRVDNFRATQSS